MLQKRNPIIQTLRWKCLKYLCFMWDVGILEEFEMPSEVFFASLSRLFFPVSSFLFLNLPGNKIPRTSSIQNLLNVTETFSQIVSLNRCPHISHSVLKISTMLKFFGHMFALFFFQVVRNDIYFVVNLCENFSFKWKSRKYVIVHQVAHQALSYRLPTAIGYTQTSLCSMYQPLFFRSPIFFEDLNGRSCRNTQKLFH